MGELSCFHSHIHMATRRSKHIEAGSSAKPTKQGYLLKRGEFNKAMKVRWCQIEDSKLMYFKKPENSKPMGFIPLDQAVVRKCREDFGEKFCFEIVTKSRVYYLVAKSQTEMAEWIHILSLRTQLHKENQLLETAETIIATEAHKHALAEETKHSESFKKRRKSLSSWAPKTRLNHQLSSDRLNSPSSSNRLVSRIRTEPTQSTERIG